MSPQETIRHVAAGNSLTTEQARTAMEGIMGGEWTPAQIAGYLVALHIKGETNEEVLGSAAVMREKAHYEPVQSQPLVDIVGSGGDGLGTINVSTLAGLVAAGAGVAVAKHGNRAMTGQCGSADILEGLGVNLDVAPSAALRGIDENGFAFLFAPHFHPSMKHAVGPRKEIGVPSIFNLLGPLTNPARAQCYVLGVARPENLRRFGEVLRGLGAERSLLVCGGDGMDEITLTGTTRVVEQTQGGELKEYEITPEELGLQRFELDALRVEGREGAVRAARAVLDGEGAPAHEALVLVNAAACITVGGRAKAMTEGLEMARESLRSGAAKRVLEHVAAYTHAHPINPAA